MLRPPDQFSDARPPLRIQPEAIFHQRRQLGAVHSAPELFEHGVPAPPKLRLHLFMPIDLLVEFLVVLVQVHQPVNVCTDLPYHVAHAEGCIGRAQDWVAPV